MTWFTKHPKISITFGFIVISLFYQIQADLAFPPPWPDEAYFLWQSVAFAENNSLFSPELNTARDVYWMPPGYMILMGTAFKLFGVSLTLARFLSWLAMLGVFLLLSHFLSRTGKPILAIIITAIIFLSAPVISASNVARMEAFLLLFVLGGFYYLLRRENVIGLSLLLIAPLIHPAGAAFLLSGIITAFMLPQSSTKPEQSYPRWLKILAVAITLAAWLTYLLYVLNDWGSFVNDMIYQLGRKSERRLAPVIYSIHHLFLATGVVLGILYARTYRLNITYLLALAIPARWVAVSGAEMWYDVYNAIAWLCFGMFFLTIIADIFGRLFSWSRRAFRVFTIGLTAVIALAWFGPGTRLPVHVSDLIFPEWRSMRLFRPDYLTEVDIGRVSDKIRDYATETSNDSLVVQMTPCADAFSYLELRKEGIAFSTPLFSQRRPDLFIFHRSVSLPPALNYQTEMDIASVTPDSLEPFLIHRRDSTESWYLVPMPAGSLEGKVSYYLETHTLE